ncbi:hypothetical protein [Vibrio sp. LaRot3]|uniref:hypothetical protein n=1 Tax=Vibrio sp. LaRot3 TaxID=2998829 RepID=UPI0022CE0C2F|nr:hypothetical protein [Vibrio sp. LaRot3]MDA0147695.1 hypothetical protein [Vibrio sp. LaRot3]
MPDGMGTPMAISNYLGVLLVLLLSYPVVLVAANMIAFGDVAKKRWSRRVNWFYAALGVIAFVMHMQTEVVYGRELYEWLESQK